MRFSPDIEELLGGTPALVEQQPPADAASRGDLRDPPGSAGGALALAGGAYEGADRFSRDLARWLPSLSSADDEILPAKPLADARSRDMLRNDAYMQAGVNLHRDNIVGAMFMLNAKPEAAVLGFDEAWAEQFQEEVEAKFTLWAESEDNWLDATRRNTLTGLVRLAVGVYCTGGEVLASVEFSRQRGRDFKTMIQMVDPDRLVNPNYTADTPTRRGGIEFDRFGAPIGYHIKLTHPSDFTNFLESNKWKFVPARKPWGRMQMLHLFEQMRVDQSRGMADIVAGLKELKTTRKFQDVQLQNAVVNATFAASIESDIPAQAWDGLIPKENDDIPGVKYADRFLDAISEYSTSSQNINIDGVRIAHLYPGTKLQLRPAGSGGALGTNFEKSLVRKLAAALNVSYEQLSRDYADSNYSSIRAGISETEKFMAGRKRTVADKFATHIYRLWLEEAINNDKIASFPSSLAPMLYTDGVLNLMFDALSQRDWIGASRGQIDELKETQAAALRISKGLSTYEIELGKLGLDHRKIFAQRGREKTALEKMGLWVDPEAKTNMENASTGETRDKSENNTDE